MGTAKNSEIDEIDRKIIAALVREGRLSFRDLGVQVHLSSNATAERVRRLRSANIIRGFHAEIDHARLGFALQAYVDVRLRPGTSGQDFETVAMNLPGVVNATILTGGVDFRLRVTCRNEPELVRLIETLRLRAGAQETSSAVILREAARESSGVLASPPSETQPNKR